MRYILGKSLRFVLSVDIVRIKVYQSNWTVIIPASKHTKSKHFYSSLIMNLYCNCRFSRIVLKGYWAKCHVDVDVRVDVDIVVAKSRRIIRKFQSQKPYIIDKNSPKGQG